MHYMCSGSFPYKCCGSVLSLVQVLFSFVFVYMVICDNEFKTKKNKNWTKDKIEPQHKHIYNGDTRIVDSLLGTKETKIKFLTII